MPGLDSVGDSSPSVDKADRSMNQPAQLSGGDMKADSLSQAGQSAAGVGPPSCPRHDTQPRGLLQEMTAP